jgi:protein-S-isoprenylcysteine O-methyltransferase Ste14
MPRPVRLAYAWLGAGAFVASLLYFVHFYLIQLDRAAPRGGAAAFAFDAALFSVFAMHHSVMARAGAKRWIARIAPPELERSTYVWLASLLFFATCLWWRPIGGEWYRAAGAGALLLYAVQAAAILMILSATAALDPLELAGVRQAQDISATAGAGSAGREEAGRRGPALLTTGVYGWVRHPVYLGWILFVFAAPCMTGDRAAFAAISTAYLAIAVPFEERSLVDIFGDEYRRYAGRVRWKIVPGVY